MKPDELAFLRALLSADCNVRDLIASLPDLNTKRAHYLLRKWTKKGWYDYGVSLDLGWLTAKGEEVAHAC